MVIFGAMFFGMSAPSLCQIWYHAHTMSLVAAVVFEVNLICLALLFKHRKDDVNCLLGFAPEMILFLILVTSRKDGGIYSIEMARHNNWTNYCLGIFQIVNRSV